MKKLRDPSDTHTFLWFIAGHVKLSGKAQAVIEDDASAFGW